MQNITWQTDKTSSCSLLLARALHCSVVILLLFFFFLFIFWLSKYTRKCYVLIFKSASHRRICHYYTISDFPNRELSTIELTLYSITRSRPCTCFARCERRPRWCTLNDLPKGGGTPCSCILHVKAGHYHPSLYTWGCRECVFVVCLIAFPR